MKSTLVAFVAVVTLAGCEGSWLRRAEPEAEHERKEPVRSVAALPSPALVRPGADVALPDIVQRALPSVVNIATTRTAKLEGHGFPFDAPFFRHFFGPGPLPAPEQRGLGSGVIVDKDVIVTNNHVVEGADALTVTTFDGRELDAKVVGTDPKSDLAVLRIRGENGKLQPLPLGDSARLRLADVVLAIGNPFGVGQTVTLGIVSATGRADLGIVDYEDFIQTDAAINPGNSGGALIDAEGNLVGIPTAIVSRTGGYMGVGFAIPSNMARPIIESLLRHGKVVRGWLGISIQDVDQDIARAMKLRSSSGVLVADVQSGSPADKSGLQRGDIVLSIDGRRIETAGQLRNLVALGGAGRKLALEIQRGNQQRQLTVTVAEMPAEAGGAPSRVTPHAPSAAEGVAVQPLNPALRQRLGLPNDVRHGVVVSEIEPGSAAARAGLRAGDVVLEIDRQKVQRVEQFHELFAKSQGPTLLLVHRRGATSFLVIKR
jgi:serine protease Do